MKTFETVITVLPDGSIHIPPRPDLTPGAHRAVLVLEELVLTLPATPAAPLKLHIRPWGGWPTDATFRREDLYDEWGR
ncbi:MAG: hypothetical protein WCJ55_17355 [Chloroflexales bacterium]